MSIFSKKKKDRSVPGTMPERNTNGISSDQYSIFRGDLAGISLSQKKEENVIRTDNTISTVENVSTNLNGNSFDGDIIMTFPDYKNDYWVCSECGTFNDNKEKTCIVCGLKSK